MGKKSKHKCWRDDSACAPYFVGKCDRREDSPKKFLCIRDRSKMAKWDKCPLLGSPCEDFSGCDARFIPLPKEFVCIRESRSSGGTVFVEFS